MKKILSLLVVSLLVSTTASAFSLGDVAVDSKTVKMQTCLTSEAKKAIAAGTITSENVEVKAAEIAGVCATSVSAEVNPEIVKLAVTTIKSLM